MSARPYAVRKVASVALAALWPALCAAAAPAASVSIYSCDVNGKRLTSDRPIPECQTRDQRVLGPDGSVRRIQSPAPTTEELAEIEERRRRDEQLRAEQKDAVRRDRNLMQRYPTEAAHQKARNAALDDARTSIDTSKKRLAVLAAERKPLDEEAEFYVRREMPAKLRQSLDANDAATEAQRALIQNQQLETVRINANFDAELARLRRLWSGVPAGSMGVLNPPPVPASAPPAKAASNR